MEKVLIKRGESNLYNIFTEICSYTASKIEYFTGYIYLHKLLYGDRLHIKISVNGKVHLFIEYSDQQIMTTVYIDPIPLLPDDVLLVEVRNLSTNLMMTSVSYILYSDT